MNSRRLALSILAIMITWVGDSCSRRQAPTGIKPIESVPANQVAVGPSFEILNTWNPKKVIVMGYETAGEKPPRFTLTPKPGAAFLAIELIMKADDPKKPIPASMWGGINLIDSSGAERPIIFDYAATLAKYTPGGDTVEYVGDPKIKDTELLNATLAQTGGKLVVVFDTSPADTNLKLDIAKRQTLPVSVLAK